MSDDRHRRVRALFDLVVDLDAAARARVLDDECGGDAELRRELDDLLSREQRTKDLRVPPVAERLQPAESESLIGPYRIVGRLGEGGFGVVHVAEQSAPLRRRVALKILKAGMDTKSVLARFDAERQTLALLDHPNIAKVFDAGETERGRPYFVMELVEGEPITAYADRRALSVPERLDLFIAVTQAVQHAHQKGIIHRDLKPSNVLVGEVDGKPVPKVIDFGIAKATRHALTEATLVTEAGQFMGTPEYMSPEQAGLADLDIDTRADIYSLGVMLYELLTGALPFDAELRRGGIARMQAAIRDAEPPRPSTRVTARGVAGAEAARQRRTDPPRLARALRRDLDWIVLKAMEKDRARRYDSASTLALEIRRFLDNEPVLAGPPSARYRLGKFARRHRVPLAVAAVVLASILSALFESNRQRVAAERARDEAEVARQDAERARGESEAVTGFLSNMLGAAAPREKGKDVTVMEILEEGAATIGERFADKPLIRARLMQTMGGVYYGLGRFDEARPFMAEAVAIREKELGPDHPDLAYSLNAYGILHMETGDLAAARPLYERALAMWEKTQGAEAPNVAQALNNLANVYWATGDYAGARPLMERALAIREKVRGPDHPSVAQTLNNLGALLDTMGDREAARSHYERALAIREKALGPEHPDVAQTLQNLAITIGAAGDPAGAIPFFERALAIQEKTLGPDHREVAMTLGDLGRAIFETGDGARARPYLERALAIQRGNSAQEPTELAASLINLGAVVAREGDTARARKLLDEAIAINRKALGPDHPEVATALAGLAAVEVIERRSEKAKALLEEAIRIGEKAFGANHPDNEARLRQLADVMRGLGDLASADALDARASACRTSSGSRR